MPFSIDLPDLPNLPQPPPSSPPPSSPPSSSPPPPPGFVPVTNGRFFEGIRFGTNPAEAGIEQTMLTLAARQANEVDEALELASLSRQQSTERLTNLNDALAALQTADVSLEAAPGTPAAAILLGPPPDANAPVQVQIPPAAAAAVAGLTTPGDGIVVNPGNGTIVFPNRTAYEAFTQRVQNEINQASNESQLDLIQFQALVNRRNQAAEFLSNLIQRFFGQSERVAGNLRV